MGWDRHPTPLKACPALLGRGKEGTLCRLIAATYFIKTPGGSFKMKPSVLPHTCFINPRLNWVIFLLRILKSNQSQISEEQAHYKLFSSFLIMRAFCKPCSAALLERGWLCQTGTRCFQSLAELITRVHGSSEVLGQIRCLLLPVGRGKCNCSGKWAWEILEDQHAPCHVSGRKNFLMVSLFDGLGNLPTQILFLVSGYRT